MADRPSPEAEIDAFCWRYLQLETALPYPRPETLREEPHQEELYRRLFADDAGPPHRPPHRYQLRVLKELVRRIEESIDDWEEHGVSEDFSSALSSLIAQPAQGEATAAQQKSYVTYHLSALNREDSPTTASPSPPSTITLLESRALIAASGTTGLRTWEAALHLGQYLCAHPSTITAKRVLELGAGTGFLSVLCATNLGAAHVLATDGSEEVIATLPDNLFLNGLQQDDGKCSSRGKVQPMELRWGHALVGTEDSLWNGGERVDVALGADITYDKRLTPALVGTLEELAGIFEGVEILISATERNRETYEDFLQVAARAGFEIEGVDFAVDGSRGPFYDDSVPIHICRLKGKGR